MKSFHPLHIEDLRKSGLSDSAIEKSGIRTVFPPSEINKKIGFNMSGLISCYQIPYDKTFSRFRAFYDNNVNGGKPKYLQRKDTGNRLYIPHAVRPILNESSKPLYITEGEKKALKATQEGLFCIGLSGLWNWKNKGSKRLIADFDLIALKDRTVYIVPDKDWLQPNKHGYRKNLKQAVNQLADRLKTQGAKVFIVELPQGEEKGLDDYLCKHTVEEFQALPVIEVKALSERIAEATPENVQEIIKEIAEIKSETEQAILIEGLSKKLNIGKRAIQKDIQHSKGDAKDELKAITSANLPGLVDLTLDETGGVVYLIKKGNVLDISTIYEHNGVLYSPPGKEHLPFGLSRAAAVIKWYQAENDKRIFEDVIACLKRFSYLPDNLFLIVVCKVFLTYIQDHPDIQYMPMILFYAVPERGKSRTGKAVAYISYRGIHVVDLREANLFRFSQNLQATLFFDLMDLWKKAERNNAEDILLLRYEKGAKAVRVIYPEKGAFEDTVFYDVYGPTIIATNEPLHKILDSRGINIIMPNKPGNYENPTPDKVKEIKERLTAWRARVQDAPLPSIEPIQGIQGRLWDISQPLLQVCKMVYPDGLDRLKEALLEVAGQRIEDKKASIEGQIVSILYEFSPEGIPEWTLKTSEVLKRLNDSRPEGRKLTSQYLGRKLKAVGLQTKIVMGYSHIQLDIETFNILLTQHGFENLSLPTSVETLLNSTTLSNQGISTDYDSRELVESQENSTETLLIQSLDNQASKSLVGSSRELQDIGEKKYLKTLEVVE
jgi:hypothetical protein